MVRQSNISADSTTTDQGVGIDGDDGLDDGPIDHRTFDGLLANVYVKDHLLYNYLLGHQLILGSTTLKGKKRTKWRHDRIVALKLLVEDPDTIRESIEEGKGDVGLDQRQPLGTDSDMIASETTAAANQVTGDDSTPLPSNHPPPSSPFTKQQREADVARFVRRVINDGNLQPMLIAVKLLLAGIEAGNIVTLPLLDDLNRFSPTCSEDVLSSPLRYFVLRGMLPVSVGPALPPGHVFPSDVVLILLKHLRRCGAEFQWPTEDSLAPLATGTSGVAPANKSASTSTVGGIGGDGSKWDSATAPGGGVREQQLAAALTGPFASCVKPHPLSFLMLHSVLTELDTLAFSPPKDRQPSQQGKSQPSQQGKSQPSQQGKSQPSQQDQPQPSQQDQPQPSQQDQPQPQSHEPPVNFPPNLHLSTFAAKCGSYCLEILGFNLRYLHAYEVSPASVGLGHGHAQVEGAGHPKRTLRGQANTQVFVRKLCATVLEFAYRENMLGAIANLPPTASMVERGDFPVSTEDDDRRHVLGVVSNMAASAQEAWMRGALFFYPFHDDRFDVLVRLLHQTDGRANAAATKLVERFCQLLSTHDILVAEFVPPRTGMAGSTRDRGTAASWGPRPTRLSMLSPIGESQYESVASGDPGAQHLPADVQQTDGQNQLRKKRHLRHQISSHVSASVSGRGTSNVRFTATEEGRSPPAGLRGQLDVGDGEAPPDVASYLYLLEGPVQCDIARTPNLLTMLMNSVLHGAARNVPGTANLDDMSCASFRGGVVPPQQESHPVPASAPEQDVVVAGAPSIQGGVSDPGEVLDEEQLMMQQALAMSLEVAETEAHSEDDNSTHHGSSEGSDSGTRADQDANSERTHEEDASSGGGTQDSHHQENKDGEHQETSSSTTHQEDLDAVAAALNDDADAVNTLSEALLSLGFESTEDDSGGVSFVVDEVDGEASFLARALTSTLQGMGQDGGALARSQQIGNTLNPLLRSVSGASSRPEVTRQYSIGVDSIQSSQTGGDNEDKQKPDEEWFDVDPPSPFYNRMRFLKRLQDGVIMAHREDGDPGTNNQSFRREPLAFDEPRCAETIELLSGGSKAMQKGDKKWGTAVAKVKCASVTRRNASSRVRQWKVRLDKCEKGHVFIGVATREASSSNYLGSDSFGWGMIGTKNLWHGRAKIRSYGHDFRTGDVVTVTLDPKAGTLSYGMKGKDWGVAFRNLTKVDQMYPAVALYQKGDSVTLLPGDASDRDGHGSVADLEFVAADLGDNHPNGLNVGLGTSIGSLSSPPSEAFIRYIVQVVEFAESELGSAASGEVLDTALVRSLLRPLLATLSLWPQHLLNATVVLCLLPCMLRLRAVLSAPLRAAGQSGVAMESATISGVGEDNGDLANVSGSWVFTSQMPFEQKYKLSLQQRGPLIVGRGSLDMPSKHHSKSSKRRHQSKSKPLGRAPPIPSKTVTVYGVVSGKRVLFAESWGSNEGSCVQDLRLMPGASELVGSYHDIGSSKSGLICGKRVDEEGHSIPPPTVQFRAGAEELEEIFGIVLGKLTSAMVRSGSNGPAMRTRKVPGDDATYSAAPAPVGADAVMDTQQPKPIALHRAESDTTLSSSETELSEDAYTDGESSSVIAGDDGDKQPDVGAPGKHEDQQKQSQASCDPKYLQWTKSDLLKCGFHQSIIRMYVDEHFVGLQNSAIAKACGASTFLGHLTGLSSDGPSCFLNGGGHHEPDNTEKDLEFLKQLKDGSPWSVELLDNWVLRYAGKSAFLTLGGDSMRRARRCVTAALLVHSGVLQEARLLHEWLRAKALQVQESARLAVGGGGPVEEEVPRGGGPEEDGDHTPASSAPGTSGPQGANDRVSGANLDVDDILKDDGDQSPSRLLTNVWKSAQRVIEWAVRAKGASGMTFTAMANQVITKSEFLLNVRPSSLPLLDYELDMSMEQPQNVVSPRRKIEHVFTDQDPGAVTTSTFVDQLVSSVTMTLPAGIGSSSQQVQEKQTGAPEAVLATLEHWKRVAKYSTLGVKGGRTKSSRTHSQVVESTVAFLKSNIKVEVLQDLMLESSWRAVMRMAGLRAVRQVVEGASWDGVASQGPGKFVFQSSKVAFLQWLAPSLRATKPENATPLMLQKGEERGMLGQKESTKILLSCVDKTAVKRSAEGPQADGGGGDDDAVAFMPSLTPFDLPDLGLVDIDTFKLASLGDDKISSTDRVALQGGEVATAGHYLSGLGGCGPALSTAIQEGFEELYSFLTADLESSAVADNTDMQLALLDTFGIFVAKDDHEFISRIGLFRVLQSLLEAARNSTTLQEANTPEDVLAATAAVAPAPPAPAKDREDDAVLWRNAASAFLCARQNDQQTVVNAAIKVVYLLASQIVIVGESRLKTTTTKGPDGVPLKLSPSFGMYPHNRIPFRRKPSGPAVLGITVFNMLYKELVAALDALEFDTRVEGAGGDGGQLESAESPKSVESEGYCFQLVLLLFSISITGPEVCQKFLSSPHWLCVMLRATELSFSPRIRHRVIRLLARLLPRIEVEQLCLPLDADGAIDLYYQASGDFFGGPPSGDLAEPDTLVRGSKVAQALIRRLVRQMRLGFPPNVTSARARMLELEMETGSLDADASRQAWADALANNDSELFGVDKSTGFQSVNAHASDLVSLLRKLLHTESWSMPMLETLARFVENSRNMLNDPTRLQAVVAKSTDTGASVGELTSEFAEQVRELEGCWASLSLLGGFSEIVRVCGVVKLSAKTLFTNAANAPDLSSLIDEYGVVEAISEEKHTAQVIVKTSATIGQIRANFSTSTDGQGDDDGGADGEVDANLGVLSAMVDLGNLAPFSEVKLDPKLLFTTLRDHDGGEDVSKSYLSVFRMVMEDMQLTIKRVQAKIAADKAAAAAAEEARKKEETASQEDDDASQASARASEDVQASSNVDESTDVEDDEEEEQDAFTAKLNDIVQVAEAELSTSTAMFRVAALKSLSTMCVSEEFVNRMLHGEVGIQLSDLLALANLTTFTDGLSQFADAEAWWGMLTDAWYGNACSEISVMQQEWNKRAAKAAQADEPGAADLASGKAQGGEAKESGVSGDDDGPAKTKSSADKGDDEAPMSEALLSMLMLGFPREMCEFALSRCGQDPNVAINYCLENSQQIEQLMAQSGSGGAGSSSSRGPSAAQRRLNMVVEKLKEMGFPEKWCHKAIDIAGDSFDEALTWILGNGDQLREEDELEEEAQKARKKQLEQQSETGATAQDEDALAKSTIQRAFPPGVGGLRCTSGGVATLISADMSVSVKSSVAGFPSVGARGLLLNGGCWYFEATVRTNGCMQIGWVDAAFTGSADKGVGVGDDCHSYAFDGYRRLKWHKESSPWGRKWNVGDVVGSAIDFERGEIWFSLNGDWENGMGCLYGGLVEGQDYLRGLCPAASMNRQERIQFNFGEGRIPLKHAPPPAWGGFSKCRPLHEAFFSPFNQRLVDESQLLGSSDGLVEEQYLYVEDCLEETIGRVTDSGRYFAQSHGSSSSSGGAFLAAGDYSRLRGSSRRGGLFNQLARGGGARGADAPTQSPFMLWLTVSGGAEDLPSAQRELAEASRAELAECINRTSVVLCVFFARFCLFNILNKWDTFHANVKADLVNGLLRAPSRRFDAAESHDPVEKDSVTGTDAGQRDGMRAFLTFAKLMISDPGCNSNTLAAVLGWKASRGATGDSDWFSQNKALFPTIESHFVLKMLQPLFVELLNPVNGGDGGTREIAENQLMKLVLSELVLASSRPFAAVEWDGAAPKDVFAMCTKDHSIMVNADDHEEDEAAVDVVNHYFWEGADELSSLVPWDKPMFVDRTALAVPSVQMAMWITGVAIEHAGFPSDGFNQDVMNHIFLAWSRALRSPGVPLKRIAMRFLSSAVHVALAELPRPRSDDRLEKCLRYWSQTVLPMDRIDNLACRLLERHGTTSPIYPTYVQVAVEFAVQLRRLAGAVGPRAQQHPHGMDFLANLTGAVNHADNVSDGPIVWSGRMTQEPLPAVESRTGSDASEKGKGATGDVENLQVGSIVAEYFPLDTVVAGGEAVDGSGEEQADGGSGDVEGSVDVEGSDNVQHVGSSSDSQAVENSSDSQAVENSSDSQAVQNSIDSQAVESATSTGDDQEPGVHGVVEGTTSAARRNGNVAALTRVGKVLKIHGDGTVTVGWPKEGGDESAKVKETHHWGHNGEYNLVVVDPKLLEHRANVSSSLNGKKSSKRRTVAIFGQELCFGFTAWLEHAPTRGCAPVPHEPGVVRMEQLVGVLELCDFNARIRVRGVCKIRKLDPTADPNKATHEAVVTLEEVEFLSGHLKSGWDVRFGQSAWIPGTKYELRSTTQIKGEPAPAVSFADFELLSGTAKVTLPHIKVARKRRTSSMCSSVGSIRKSRQGVPTVKQVTATEGSSAKEQDDQGVTCVLKYPDFGSVVVVLDGKETTEAVRQRAIKLFGALSAELGFPWSEEMGETLYLEKLLTDEDEEILGDEDGEGRMDDDDDDDDDEEEEFDDEGAYAEYVELNGDETLGELVEDLDLSERRLSLVVVQSMDTDDEEEEEDRGNTHGGATTAAGRGHETVEAITCVSDVGRHTDSEECLVLQSRVDMSRDQLLRLSPVYHGDGIVVSKDGLKVHLEESVGESRGMAFADVGFSSGKHYWEVKVASSQVDYGSIFIGVSERVEDMVAPGGKSLSQLNRWDKLPASYGFVNFRATYQTQGNSSNEQIYGEFFGAGDTIGVYLDMDVGEISFFVDGMQFGCHTVKDLGTAFTKYQINGKGGDERSNGRPLMLFPTVGIRRSSNDKLEITSKHLSFPCPSPGDVIESAKLVCEYLELVRGGTPVLAASRGMIDRAYKHWIRWLGRSDQAFKTYPCRAGRNVVEVNTSRVACEKVWASAGVGDEGMPTLYPGDRVCILETAQDGGGKPEEAVVLGVRQGKYWYRVDSTEDGAEDNTPSLAWYWESLELGALEVISRADPPRDPRELATELLDMPIGDLMSLSVFETQAFAPEWTLAMDKLLVSTTNDECNALGSDIMNASLPELSRRVYQAWSEGSMVPSSFLEENPDAKAFLGRMKPVVVASRLAVLRLCNGMTQRMLPLLSSNANDPIMGLLFLAKAAPCSNQVEALLQETRCAPSMASMVTDLRDVLFTSVKKVYWEAVLHATTTPTALGQEEYVDPPQIRTVNVNRIKAAAPKLAAMKSESLRVKNSVFGQLFGELRNWSEHSLRRAYVGKGHGGQKRAFKVRFMGEGVNDHGGPYRAAFEQMAEELQNDHEWADSRLGCLLPLFLPCSNRYNSSGDVGRDKFVFSPSTKLSNHTSLSMYHFLGRLMGAAVRHDIQVGLNLPKLVWKTLAGLSTDMRDIAEFDTVFVNEMARIEHASGTAAEESLSDCLGSDRYMQVSLSDGSVVSLLPNGGDIPVTFENRDLFLRLAEKVRTNESIRQLSAFRAGLATVLPMELMNLFTADELEDLICGQSNVDLVLLKQCTDYERVSESEDHIKYFWEVLEDMSDEERCAFLRFVWARSRMPLSQSDMPMNFKITAPSGGAEEDPDKYLPSAKTCFFSLSLPKYSSKQVMKEKMLYAIRCTLMDADVRLRSAEGWADA